MKIVRIIARLNVGGPARHVVWLTAALQNASYDSTLVTGVVPPGEDDMSYFAAAHNVVPMVIPEMSRAISLTDAVTIWKLYRLLARLRPDIVHTHTAKAGTVGRLAGFLYRWLTPATLIGRPRRCHFVHTYHGHVFHSYYGTLKTRLFLFIEKILARLVTDRIIVLSEQQFSEIHERFGVGREEQFRIVPLGLDTNVFKDWQLRRNIVRDELHVKSDDEILIGIVGRLTEVKNHKLFLRAAAKYKRLAETSGTNAHPARFVIIGDGHLREELEQEADALGLARGREVIFLGKRDDAENFYPALDIVALSSFNEGTPLTLIEAMANARPVIATAVGGVVDLLGERMFNAPGDQAKEQRYAIHERGVSVPSNDADAFCEGLARLAADENLRRMMGDGAPRFVEKSFSKDRLLDDIKKLYRELTTQHRTTSELIESHTAPAARESNIDAISASSQRRRHRV